MVARGAGVARSASELCASYDVVHDIFLQRKCATRTGDCELLWL